MKTFWVKSMYGHHTKQAIVVVTMPGGESVQMSANDARDLAANIFRAAEAAESDKAFVDVLIQEFDFDERQATGYLQLMREKRANK